LYIFWWTGKGYLTPVILILVLSGFGLLLQASRPLIPDTPWFWGIALIVAGVINWRVGRRKNARKIAAVRSTRLRDTLIYPARHKFMSLPFETWSGALVLGGLIAIGYGLTHS
jgi:hypothetical protein